MVQHIRPNLGLSCQSPALMVIETQSPIAELLAKDPVLLAKVVNDLQLALIHPPGNGDQQKAEWVDNVTVCGNRPCVALKYQRDQGSFPRLETSIKFSGVACRIG